MKCPICGGDGVVVAFNRTKARAGAPGYFKCNAGHRRNLTRAAFEAERPAPDPVDEPALPLDEPTAPAPEGGKKSSGFFSGFDW